MPYRMLEAMKEKASIVSFVIPEITNPLKSQNPHCGKSAKIIQYRCLIPRSLRFDSGCRQVRRLAPSASQKRGFAITSNFNR